MLERALLAAHPDPPLGLSPEQAEAAIESMLGSIGDTCPECPPEAGLSHQCAARTSPSLRQSDGRKRDGALDRSGIPCLTAKFARLVSRARPPAMGPAMG